ncbi:MAG: CxxC-x17-CxxC domain-containing protein [Nanoarchaeota archaeon]
MISFNDNDRGGGSDRRSFGGNRRSGSGGGGGFRRDFGPREMHKAKCSDCGKDCEVPFKPTEGKPVFCKECYAKKRGF